MAEVTSLGVHTPVALPYLISEGILPEDPSRELYQWETYVIDEAHGSVEEEVLVTETCVTWSQGKFVRNAYRFELEGEHVIQAVLTSFPSLKESQFEGSKDFQNGTSNVRIKNATDRTHGELHSSSKGLNQKESGSSTITSNRALVVFLKTKAHVYLLNGSSHIVDLPFEIIRAFPAPRGAILQRKTSLALSLPTTPQVPAAPPNSFLSSQLQPSSSYLQSPTIARSFGRTQPSRPSPLSGKIRLDGVFPDILVNQQEDDENIATLYSLTNPFSDLGVVSCSIQHMKHRLSSKAPNGLGVEFEDLDSAEDFVYVSSSDELRHDLSRDRGPLILIVTANRDMQTLTIWHAWYIEERSLASLMRQRATLKAAKARRRSSFLSAGVGTGTATPAVRHREGTRESFAGVASIRLPGEPNASQPSALSSRKPTRQEEEEVMASQMDPDYQPGASQQTARESRRISSLNTDVRASQHNPNASFGVAGGRRHTSFGGPNERRSLGHRKSRGSTPGSLYSRSQGLDDDLMDVDSSMDADGDDTVDSIVRHIRATFEAAGAESIFGSEEGFKRELIVRKLHSIPMGAASLSPDHTARKIRIATQSDLQPLRDTDDRRLNVYIHESHTKIPVCVQLVIKQRPLWPETTNSQVVAIPIASEQRNLPQCTDITKLRGDRTHAILLAERGLIFSLDSKGIFTLPATVPYRMYNATDMSSIHKHADKDIERNRTLERPEGGSICLGHTGANGRFSEIDGNGLHRRLQMKMRPSDGYINKLLEVCQCILPARQAQMVSGVWCNAYASLNQRSERLIGSAQNSEWIAFVATVFVFTIHLLDGKAQAALDISGVAASQGTGNTLAQLRRANNESQLSTHAAWDWMEDQRPVSGGSTFAPSSVLQEQAGSKDHCMVIAAALAKEMLLSEIYSISSEISSALVPQQATKLLLGLHIMNEEQKLCVLSLHDRREKLLAPLIAQLGSWLGIPAWGYGRALYYELDGGSELQWAFVPSSSRQSVQMPLMDEPVGVFNWFEHALNTNTTEKYPTLDVVAGLDSTTSLSTEFQKELASMTPRIGVLSDVLAATAGMSTPATNTVETMATHGITIAMMETLPSAIAAPLKDAISRAEKEPPTTWTPDLLTLVGREDLIIDHHCHVSLSKRSAVHSPSSAADVQAVCHALDQPPHSVKTREASRHAVSQLIFNEDRRLVEATSLMHYTSAQVAECPKQPDWSDAFHFEQQRRVMQWVTMRMIALPAGDAMMHYDSQSLLLTDRYHLPGFSNSCMMQPMGHTLTTDRSGLTEEKVNWAYFHAGVSAGLRISRSVVGIDTSWIAFNKPNELTNRHAGLLLALGLSGHLRHLAKWLSFKYLTPKHTMTSVGLLLGLSASYMGTMDGLITRMLSVHITRMLPPGAAELNVSPITQTAGLVGIGLLYYNTQHRRMSEIMLSEVEHMEVEDPDSGPDPLRDESYRLAAGIALGFINLGKGKDLRGLHGMYLPERLLAVAVGPRPVNAIHIFDRATAGAVIALTLVYMKSGDKAIARKIDIPDTEAKFDHVRPDMLMLRAMAKHLILWDTIQVENSSTQGVPAWIEANLPGCYRMRFRDMSAWSAGYPLKSSDVPFFNIVTGLAWALSLRYAGSGNATARDEILNVLDHFYMVKGGVDVYYYDAKLARSTVRRCIDVLALAASTVMAGTGDLRTFRYLRRLHGRTNPDTPYGSHLAAHLAIGVLFLGGGTFTFGTSNLAIASLICAFYPLFPMNVHDNHVHLQALRHFWVFAAEARCLVVEESDTHRPISMPILVTLTNGVIKTLIAPCLLPELDTIATVQTNDPTYWRVTLGFISNPEHLSSFRENQRILVRRCPASEAHHSVFSATLAAMNDAQCSRLPGQQIWQTVFNLPVFKELDKADIELILPPDVHSATHTDDRGTVVDDRLALDNSVESRQEDVLWNLRVLFAWAERARDQGEGRVRWIGNEVIEALKAKVQERMEVL